MASVRVPACCLLLLASCNESDKRAKLDPVMPTSCQAGQTLVWTGTAWACTTPTLDTLACQSGESLGWDGTGWACVAQPPVSRWLDVMTLGATGDAATDDTAAVQAALDQAAGQAGTVFFPTGRYVVEDLTVASSVTIRGEGIGRSVLLLKADSANGADILNNADQTNGNTKIRLLDLTFDGNKQAQSTPTHQLVNFFEVDDFVVERCELRASLGNGLVIQKGSGRGYIGNSWAHDNEYIGFYAQERDGSSVHQLRFVGCISNDNGQGYGLFDSGGASYVGCLAQGNVTESGFNFDSARYVALSGCVARGNARGFATWSSGSQRAHDISFSGCVAEGNGPDGFDPNGATGFQVSGSYNITFSGCQARNNTNTGFLVQTVDSAEQAEMVSIAASTASLNGRFGIWLRGARLVTVSAAVITDNSQEAAGSFDGIRIGDGAGEATAVSSGRVSIVGSTITDTQLIPTQGYAVRSLGSSDQVRIIATDVAGNGESAPIHLVGAENSTALNTGE
ncbi:glycosyl hydrolase family 28-related protein [Myxococcota bacterium]